MTSSKTAGPSRIKVKVYRVPPRGDAAQRRDPGLRGGIEPQAQLNWLGIRPVTVTMYEWDGLRFPSVDAAIAAASEQRLHDFAALPARVPLTQRADGLRPTNGYGAGGAHEPPLSVVV